MSALVSEQSRLLIQVLLTDTKIAEKVFENMHDKEKYKICTIESNGVVTLGKTSCRLWNRLLNCQDKLTFESFALKVWDALVDASSGLNNEAILNGLSHEIVINTIREHKYDKIVKRLFECWTHVAQDSAGYEGIPSPEGDLANGQGTTRVINVRQNEPRSIIINVKDKKHVIPFVDSIGDTFNFGLEFGITGLKRIYP